MRLASLLLAAAGCGLAGPADPIEFYRSRVRPILVKQCYACHTEQKMAGLRLDSRESILNGGQSGPAIVPGKPDESLLIRAVSHTHERLRMPPQGKLSEEQIRDLRVWIEAGAHFDVLASPMAASPGSKSSWTPEHKNYWAFQRPRKTALPKVQNTAWPRSPIDYFILARLEEKGLEPARPADKRTLLRRVALDLLGLPPTPQEMRDFLNDESPDAFAKVVERLLASPLYGERWGRHWQDVARYADEDALGLNPDPFPNAYRYRDWVIRAFNQDMPYDLFVKAQIAGDLLESDSEDTLKPGVGLFGLGPWYYKIVEPAKAMADELHDRVDVLSRGFLALTVACARCHDHKYDPISNQDYYALAGVFFNTRYTEYPLATPEVVTAYDEAEKKIQKRKADINKLLEVERKRLGERLARETARYLVAAWRQKNGSSGMNSRSKLDEQTFERWVRYLKAPSKEHPYLAWWDKLDPRTQVSSVREAADKFQAFLESLIQEQKEIQEYNERVIEESKKSTDPYDLFCKGCNAVTRALSRDKFRLWGELFEAERKTNGEEKPPGVLYYADDQIERFLSEDRKAELAALREELKALQQALPKRYPFLHIVRDTKDPQDMRRQIRGDPYNLGEVVPRQFLSILSNPDPAPLGEGSGRLALANQIASTENPLTARVMVNRVWHHHFGAGLVRTLSNFGRVGERPSHPELLDYLATRFVENGWSVKKLHREILLSASYAMSSEFSEKAFAADPENRLLWRANRVRLDAEALRDSMLFVAGNLDLSAGGPPVEWTRENRRRTVYGSISRFRLERFLNLFDFSNPTISAEKRAVTSTPIQRLFFLNSDFIKEQSRALAVRVEREVGDDPGARIDRTCQLLFERNASQQEVRLARDFLAENGDRAGWQKLAQTLLSSNEFLYVD